MKREEAIKILSRPFYMVKVPRDILEAHKMAIDALEQEPKTGHWEDCSNGWMCSVCERDSRKDTKYCPNCGAKMEVEE